MKNDSKYTKTILKSDFVSELVRESEVKNQLLNKHSNKFNSITAATDARGAFEPGVDFGPELKIPP